MTVRSETHLEATQHTRMLSRELSLHDKLLVLTEYVALSGLAENAGVSMTVTMALCFGVYIDLLRYRRDFFGMAIWFALPNAIREFQVEKLDILRYYTVEEHRKMFFTDSQKRASLLPFGHGYNRILEGAGEEILMPADKAILMAQYTMMWIGQQEYVAISDEYGVVEANRKRGESLELLPDMFALDEKKRDAGFGLTLFSRYIESEEKRARLIAAIERKFQIRIDLKRVDAVRPVFSAEQLKCIQCKSLNEHALNEKYIERIFCSVSCQREYYYHQ
jgi:hypothetical protein